MDGYELQLKCSSVEDTLSEITINDLKIKDKIDLASQIAGLKQRNLFQRDIEDRLYPEHLTQVRDIKLLITSLIQTYKGIEKM